MVAFAGTASVFLYLMPFEVLRHFHSNVSRTVRWGLGTLCLFGSVIEFCMTQKFGLDIDLVPPPDEDIHNGMTNFVYGTRTPPVNRSENMERVNLNGAILQ